MKILLADDDKGVIDTLFTILESIPGHNLRAAATGGQALQQAMAMEGVDLLITDVVMEPMDGFTLRNHLAAKYPELRTVFITGYDLSDYAEQIGTAPVVMKPIDHAELFAALRQECPGQFGDAESAPEPIAVEPDAEVVEVAEETLAIEPLVETAVPEPISPPPVPEPEPVVVAAPAVVAVAAPTPVDGAPSTSLIGQTLGAYQILSHLGEGRWGGVFAAVQTSINRPVGLKILSPERARDPAIKERFVADARAKAHVQHPTILAVYEAGETGGYTFYTHEFVEGRNLAELQVSGEKLDEPTALKVLKVIAEGFNYLNTKDIPHSPPAAPAIYLSVDGQPRLANLALQLPDEQLPVDQEIPALGRILLGVLPAIQTISPGFRALFSRMVQTGPQTVKTWGEVIQSVKALEPKVIPMEAAKISAQDRVAIAAVESARKSQKRSIYINLGLISALIVIAGLVIAKFVISNERQLDAQLEIPAGTFLFGNNLPTRTETFWIDKFEVTIGEYAKFIRALEQRPTTEYDHPKQPRAKAALMHKPADWRIYFERATSGKPIHGVPSDLNMPAIMVDWWDAYAYAKWKGRELPSEQEWEKAARGTEGFLYPWGNNVDPSKVNSNADYDAANPSAPGKIDGFNFWGAVDRQKGDRSPYGVIGMAGNVAEWTASWTPDGRFPILKGGNYLRADARLDQRIDNLSPNTASEAIGFRTVSRTPPKSP